MNATARRATTARTSDRKTFALTRPIPECKTLRFREAAHVLGITETTLRKWEQDAATAPAGRMKMGKSRTSLVLYDRDKLLAWLTARSSGGVPAARAAPS